MANPCADVEIRYKGDGVVKLFTFPFTYLDQNHIYVSLWDDSTKEYKEVPRTDWSFANATTIEFNTAPTAPPIQPAGFPEIFNVTIYRQTDVSRMEAVFYPGSAIRAEDLNDDFDQLRLAIQESRCQVFGKLGDLSKVSWNKYSITAASAPGKTGDTITKQDQREGRWTGSDNDLYIATTDAISARLDPYVQDSVPPAIGVPEREQPGKSWYDTDELVERFWDPDANAWVTLANTGPMGPQGPIGLTGTYATIVSATKPTKRLDGTALQQGDVWFNTNTAYLYVWYNDGDSTQWVSITKPGPQGTTGAPGAPGATGPKGATGTYSTIIQPTAPTVRNDGSALVPGDVWFNTNKGRLYALYNDGDSTQWISLSEPGMQGIQGPSGPTGSAGPQGPVGPAGAKGDPGPLPSITSQAPITATTLGAAIDFTFDPIPLTNLP